MAILATDRDSGKSVGRLAALLLAGTAMIVPAAAQEPQKQPYDPNAKVVWDSSVYADAFRSKIIVPEVVGLGIAGGVSKTITIPGSFETTTVTRMIVYHDESRVYGIQLGYDQAGKGYQETDVLGGDAGQRTEIELDRDKTLHFVRGHYGPDPAGHYKTHVLTGLEVGYYTLDPLRINDGVARSHNEMIATKTFGKRVAGASSPPEGVGFDIHKFQGLGTILACVSPMDRNGRIFTLGVSPRGLTHKPQNPPDLCPKKDSNWSSQPLGPPRIQEPNPFGKPEIAKRNRDPYEYATGMYSKEGEQYARSGSRDPSNPSSADEYSSKWDSPKIMIARFGDTAKIRFGGRVEPTFDLPLIRNDHPQARKDRNYTFQYGYPNGTFIGVELRNPKGTEEYAYVTFDFKHASGRKYVGRYREVRLGDTGGDVVAKRNREREDVVKSGQSRKGLFEVSNVAKGYDYLLRGYDAPNMSLRDINGGLKGFIFTEPNEYQYYISNTAVKAIPDGLLYYDMTQGTTDEKQTIMTSQKQVSDVISRSLGVTVPIKGVPVGASYSQSASSGLNQSQNKMLAMGASRNWTHAFVNDMPNNFLSVDFTEKLQDLYNSSGSSQSRAASEMVNKFGSHYANAIIYGGLGFVSEEMDASTYGTNAEKSYTAGAKVGNAEKLGGEISASQSETTKRAQSQTSSYRSKNWSSRGGAGSYNELGWQVTPENAVPVLYDLRPISDLVESVTLAKALGPDFDPKRAKAAKDALWNAVESRHEQYLRANPISSYSTEPTVYRLKINGLTCTSGGDEGKTATIDLYGKITLQFYKDGVNQTLALMDSPDNNKRISCNSSLTTNIVGSHQIFFTYEPGKDRSGNQGFSVASVKYNLTEDDNSFTDKDDVASNIPSLANLPINGGKVDGAAFADFNSGGPTVYVEYTWEKLN